MIILESQVGARRGPRGTPRRCSAPHGEPGTRPRRTAGGDLRTDAGQRRAVFAYNHSDSYVNQVLALARAYASGIPVADLPLSGNTTGAVPAPDWSGIPAAPGPAIGLRDRTSSPPEQTAGTSPPAPVDPPSPPAPVDGVSCNVVGNLVPDIPGQPVCPPA